MLLYIKRLIVTTTKVIFVIIQDFWSYVNKNALEYFLGKYKFNILKNVVKKRNKNEIMSYIIMR